MHQRLLAIIAAVVLAGCSAGGKTSSSSTTTSAADLVVSLDKTSITDDGTAVATVTVTAVDSNRNAVASVPVLVVPDNNGVYTAASTTTSTAGIVTGTLGIGSDRSNRTIDLVVTSGSITKHASVTVTGATLSASAGSAAAGSTASVSYHLTDSSSVDIVGVPIQITNGTDVVTGTTDSSGKYTYTYTVPSQASVTISALAGGVTTTSSVTISSSSVSAATGTVRSASVAVDPVNVNVNTAGSTTNSVDVRALFLGDNNAPIQYARVKFDLDGDTNSIGGTLSSGTGYVYTDANGIARTTYIPGTRGSGNQQLTIRACWSEADFTTTCPNQVTTSLTVVDSSVSLSIFNNGLITAIDAESVYQLTYAVQVVDSVGNPVSGVTVSGSVNLPYYYRGVYSVGTSAWVRTQYNECPNEDLNGNNILETYSNGDSEDADSSGDLEPRKADVLIVPQATGSNVTDSFGKAYFLLQYGESVASWDAYTVTFNATVQGTEGRATTKATKLPVPASALTDTTVSPPFEFSPYGTSLVSTTLVTYPGTTSVSAYLCTNSP